MPNYDYLCEKCGHEEEIFQNMSAEPVAKCPKCGSKRFKRLIGTGAGIIFKGSGFYETDYKTGVGSKKEGTGDVKKQDSKSKKSESKAAETAAAS